MDNTYSDKIGIELKKDEIKGISLRSPPASLRHYSVLNTSSYFEIISENNFYALQTCTLIYS